MNGCFHNFRFFLSVSLLLANVLGCAAQPEEQPQLPYSEALAIYNQELQALDRLKKQRSELEAKLEPSETEFADEILNQASELGAELNQTFEDLGIAVEPPNAGTDLDGNAGQESDPIDEIRQQLAEAEVNRQQKAENIKERIAELDREIAAQQRRVDQAKADRDQAERRLRSP